MNYYVKFKELNGCDRADWLVEQTCCGKILGEGYCRQLIQKLEDIRFFEAPASTKYHGNYAGGLYEHSFFVTDILCRMTEELQLNWKQKRSPVIVGLLHDLCKVDQYEYDEDQGVYTFSDDPLVKGHGIKSVVYIQQLLHIDLTEEETACILYHMGAFTDSKEWNNYNRAIQKYPNVLWTHTADMVASQIMGV